jgi:hypothetical protein
MAIRLIGAAVIMYPPPVPTAEHVDLGAGHDDLAAGPAGPATQRHLAVIALADDFTICALAAVLRGGTAMVYPTLLAAIPLSAPAVLTRSARKP